MRANTHLLLSYLCAFSNFPECLGDNDEDSDGKYFSFPKIVSIRAYICQN